MNKFSDGIRLSKKEYNDILNKYGKSAIESRNIKTIIDVAKLELDLISTGVTNMDRPKELCYKDDYLNLSRALNLLKEADELRRDLLSKK